MFERWIRGVARARWLVVALWVALTVASVFVLPDLGKIVKETESKFVPSDAESVAAQTLLDQITPGDKERSNVVIVLHREGGLQDADRKWLEGKVNDLNSKKQQLDLMSIHSAFEDPQLAEKFESKDKTTDIVAVGLPKDTAAASTQETVDKLRTAIHDGVPKGAESYLTGSAAIGKDYVQNSQDGLAKTEVLTIALVLVILLSVFRSPIAPFVPLITIAMSFLLARGFTAVATKYGLPVSEFTETFLVAVLFGAGTDYCILLIHRFREELSKGGDRVDALVRTMQTVGKTVIYSGSTVLIAFFLIGFAKFGMYQSAVGVAIGMFATLVAGMTLTPALMILLGPKLFWPFKIKEGEGHHDSKMWAGMARLVSRKPLLVLIVATLALAPLTLLFQGKRSFDDLADMSQDIESVKGFKIVEKSFSAGEVLPVEIVLTSSDSMRTPERIAAIEKASAALAQIPEVKEVRSAARPLGEQLEDLTVPKQLDQANKGLGDIKNGVTQLSSGLTTAKTELGKGVDGMGKMTSALSTISEKQRDVASGSSQIAKGTSQVAAGLAQGAYGLQQSLPNVDKMGQGLAQMAGKTREMQTGLTQAADGLTKTGQGLGQLSQGVGQSKTVAASMSDDLNALLKSHPELANDPSIQALTAKQQGLTKGLGDAENGFQPLQDGLKQIVPGISQVAGGLGQTADAQAQLAGGVTQMHQQTEQLAKGLSDSVAALNQLSSGAGQMTSGLNQLADGTGKMNSQVGTFQSGLGELSNSLGTGSDALNKMADGLTQIHDAQQGIVDNNGKQVVGWYLPESALDNADFKKGLDTYVSPDGKITKFDIVLGINPYSHEAMNVIETIRTTLTQSLHDSAIKTPDVKVGGQTAQYHELDGISNDDFVRTGALILVGIYVVLALLLRSVLAPIYLLLSLGFSYLVTMGVVEWIFVKVLGQEGLSWTVSFFAFILLVALGVDYSIFLMARFKEEYKPGYVVEAMMKAMKTTGGVIISAAIIMGGTFAALIFSGVGALMQIGISVLIGLTIYTTIVMGLIVPALAMLFGEANWWPLKRSNRTGRFAVDVKSMEK